MKHDQFTMLIRPHFVYAVHSWTPDLATVIANVKVQLKQQRLFLIGETKLSMKYLCLQTLYLEKCHFQANLFENS